MASTSAEQSHSSQSIELCNTQTTWLVPTKYKLYWKIEDVCDFKQFKCPKMSGPAGTKFIVFLRINDTRNYFVEMESISDRGPLMIKGEISVNNAQYFLIKRPIKKGFDVKKLLIDSVSVQENNTIEVHLEFIAYPVKNQFLKVNKNAAQFGEKLREFVTKNIDDSGPTSLADCSLQTNSENVLFQCHKTVLCSRSSKLDSWLETCDSVPISVFQNCNDPILQGLLDYLYMANPYMLIEKYSLREVKEISKLGRVLEVAEIDGLYEEREFSIITKIHKCGTVFEATMTNNEFFQLKSEPNSKIDFKNFTFCKSEWNMYLVKKETSGNETFTIVLKKTSRGNIVNVEVHVWYLNLQKEWVELQEVNSGNNKQKLNKGKPKKKKRKCSEVKENTLDSKKNDLEFKIENEFLQELFESPSSSQAEKFRKLILKCDIRHKKFDDNADLRIKTLDASRFLYDRQHFNGLSADLKKFYGSKKYTNLKIKVRFSDSYSRKFKVHKIILAARSSIFKQKIYESIDDKIEIEADMKLLEKFDEIVNFLYTNEIDFNAIPALKVYEFAFRYSVIDLMNSARLYITEHICENIASNAMREASKCEDEIFKADIKKFMSKNHSKKWDPEINEFILKPKDFCGRPHKTKNAEISFSEANETSGSDSTDEVQNIESENTDDNGENDNQVD